MKFSITLLLALLFVKSFSQEINLSEFKHGFFHYQNRFANTVVYIKGNYRIDYDLETKKWLTLKADWDSDSTCVYTFVSTNIESVKKYLGQSFDASVYKMLPNGYVYYTQLQNSSKRFKYEMVQLDRELSKSDEKRVVETLKHSKHVH